MTNTRVLTVIVTDLVGSTETIARLGAQAGETWRKGHLELLRGALAAGRGREIQHTGDGLLAAFESASEAVTCAKGMQKRIARENRRRDLLAPLSVRIGLSAGEVTEDSEGVHGLVVVEAARLCAAAKGGQVLATTLVQALCAGHSEHQFASVGSLELKGIPAPVAVVEVTCETERANAVPLPLRLGELGQGAFVGRASERERLAAAWREVSQGERRIALVAGEPGIGKTRLASELAREAHAAGSLVLYGRCDEDLGAPYQPWVQALSHYALHASAEELRTELKEAGHEVARILPELVRRFPELAVPTAQDPESDRFALFESVDGLLAAASRGAPVLLVLDDLHWADKPSLLLLRHLVRSDRPAALFVLVTYRETDLARTHPLADLLADLRREKRVERLLLRGLGESELGALVASRGQEEPPIEFVRALHAETEGNPFFAEEVLRHLVESGVLRREEGGWKADRPIADLGIPESIREVVGRRLSRLSETANEALAVASVVGRDFEVGLVETVSRIPDSALVHALEEALRARLVRETETPGRLSFSHALVRLTLYEELGTLRRVRLHWQIGKAIESRHADSLDGHLSELAYHFAEGAVAGDPLRSVDWSLRAGARAAALLAHEEALVHYRRALSTLDELGELQPERRYEALLGIGQVGNVLAERETYMRALLDAAHLARSQGWIVRQARAVIVSSDFAGGDAEVVGGLIRETLAALPPGDSPERVMLLARRVEESIILLRAPSEVEADVSEALAIARRLGGPEELEFALVAKGFSLLGTPEAAQELFQEEDLARFDAIGTWRVRNIARRERLVAALVRGQREAFEGRLGEYRAFADRSRSAVARFFALCWDALIAFVEGRFQEAKRLAASARDAISRNPGLVLGYNQLVMMARLEQGGEAELIPGLERFVATAPAWLATLRAVLVNAYAAVGREPQARAELERLTADSFASIPRNFGLAIAVRHLAEVCARLEDREAARRLEPLAVPYTGLLLVPYEGTVVEAAADRACAQIAATLGRLDEADALYRRALALEEGFRAPVLAARTRYWWARALAERGKPGDTERARELVADSVAEAHRMGMRTLEREAAALEAMLGG
jgi:class 3 adenylate cyclase/tetratricopeptide (TPR) repeat protein